MKTPIIILVILIAPYLINACVRLIGFKNLPDRIVLMLGLSLAFAFFGVGHFVMTEPLSRMIPDIFPFRIELVYLTGVLEFLLALALLFPQSRYLAALGCIAVLIGFFPFNIYAAFQSIDVGGHAWGPVYLWLRAPLQIILLAWCWFLVVKPHVRYKKTAY